MLSRLLAPLVLALLSVVSALSSSGNRLLVVLEEEQDQDKYSRFLKDVKARGFQPVITSPKAPELSLFNHGERAYDHIVLLPGPAKGLGPALTANKLLEFMKNEGNLLLALSSSHPIPTAISSLLLELDLQVPPERHSAVVDHFNYDTTTASETHDVLLVPFPDALRPDVRNFFAGTGDIAVPRAVAQTLGNASPLLAPILRAPSTAYSYNTKDETEAVDEPFAVGEQIALVSSMQAHNGARLVALGSAEMLQDRWMNEKRVGNRAFVNAVAEWTFKEVGVLKVGKVTHFLNEGGATAAKANFSAGDLEAPEQNPKIYRIKNDVTFILPISEYSHTHLIPFSPPPNDTLQLEFSMLSPFYRIPLTPLPPTQQSYPNATLFTASLTTPDQHGIFNFHVGYRRPFLSSIEVKRQVTVRHFAHNEYERSYHISAAWVWVSGIAVTVTGWLAFVAMWLYCRSTDIKNREKKAQ